MRALPARYPGDSVRVSLYPLPEKWPLINEEQQRSAETYIFTKDATHQR